jgi:phage-related baseplate assembly protein
MTSISLPPPDNLQSLDFEELLAELKADILAALPDEATTIDLESDPINEQLQALAYRVVIQNNRANSQAQSIMLALAVGPQLDQLGRLPFFNVARKVIAAAEPLAFPPVAEVLEGDEEYRERIRLSLLGLSVAGPAQAYRYHALSAHPDVLDVSVDRPQFTRFQTASTDIPANAIVIIPTYDAGLTDPLPNDIAITVMTRDPGGQASQAVTDAISAALNGETVRPISDRPRVRSVVSINVAIDATLYLYEGNEQDSVLALASQNLTDQLAKLRSIGNDLTLSAIHAGLHIGGVQRVVINSPVADTIISPSESFAATVALTYGGVAQ